MKRCLSLAALSAALFIVAATCLPSKVIADDVTPTPTETPTVIPTDPTPPPPTPTVTPTRTPTPNGLARVCKKIRPWGWRVLYKFEASGHLSQSDRAHACSLIYGLGSTVPAINWLNFYDKKGNYLSVFKNYARGGSMYKARFYTYSPTCAQIAASAKRRTGAAVGYIHIGNRQCIKVNNLYGRQGGVR